LALNTKSTERIHKSCTVSMQGSARNGYPGRYHTCKTSSKIMPYATEFHRTQASPTSFHRTTPLLVSQFPPIAVIRKHRSTCNKETALYRSGVSNLFDRRAKCTNFKLVGGQMGMGSGVPISSQLRGLGEQRKLPQWGPGQSPGRKRVLAYFRA